MLLTDILDINNATAEQLSKQLLPLHELLGIDHVTVYDVDNQSNMLILDSNVEYLQHYIESGMCAHDPHIAHNSCMSPSFVLWPDLRDIDTKTTWHELHRKFYTHSQGFSVVDHNAFGYQCFAFSNNAANNTLSSFHEYSHCILAFVEILQKQANILMEDLDEARISVSMLRSAEQLNNSIVNVKVATAPAYGKILEEIS